MTRHRDSIADDDRSSLSLAALLRDVEAWRGRSVNERSVVECDSQIIERTEFEYNELIYSYSLEIIKNVKNIDCIKVRVKTYDALRSLLFVVALGNVFNKSDIDKLVISMSAENARKTKSQVAEQRRNLMRPLVKDVAVRFPGYSIGKLTNELLRDKAYVAKFGNSTKARDKTAENDVKAILDLGSSG